MLVVALVCRCPAADGAVNGEPTEEDHRPVTVAGAGHEAVEQIAFAIEGQQVILPLRYAGGDRLDHNRVSR